MSSSESPNSNEARDLKSRLAEAWVTYERLLDKVIFTASTKELHNLNDLVLLVCSGLPKAIAERIQARISFELLFRQLSHPTLPANPNFVHYPKPVPNNIHCLIHKTPVAQCECMVRTDIE